MSEQLAAALDYARRGWASVPADGKRPRFRSWPDRASTNPDTVREWWRRWPDANVGVVVRDSFVAIDVDPRRGDDDALDDLERERELGPLPETPRYLTGGHDGGWRILLRHPGGDLAHQVGGIELKHGRQFILMPPSRTVRRYEWEVDPDEQPLAEIPPAWLERMTSAPVAPAGTAVRRREHDDDALLAVATVDYVEAITGRTPERGGYVRCPFHSGGGERTPSLKLYDTTWACFACPPQHGAGRRCLGGTIYTFAALAWGYPLPLRDVAFLTVQDRLLRTITDHLTRKRSAA